MSFDHWQANSSLTIESIIESRVQSPVQSEAQSLGFVLSQILLSWTSGLPGFPIPTTWEGTGMQPHPLGSGNLASATTC